MCFSPEVSFSLAGALGAGGAYCIYKAIRSDRGLWPLAIVPVVFGVQQFFEGWVWTGVERGDPGLTKTASLCYLFFALFFWPFWIPYSMLLMERSRTTRRFLRLMTAMGIILGLALIVPVIVAPAWLTVQVSHHSIHYDIDRSPIFAALPDIVWKVLYLIVVATPLLVSSVQKMVHVGLALVISAAVAQVLFNHAFTSVWCFFAAALSLYLCVFFATLPGSVRTPDDRLNNP